MKIFSHDDHGERGIERKLALKFMETKIPFRKYFASLEKRFC